MPSTLEFAPAHDRPDEPVSVAEQLEILRAPVSPEMREKIESAESHLIALLVQIGLQTHELSESAITDIVDIDPNFICCLDTEKMSSREREERVRGLWASVTGYNNGGYIEGKPHYAFDRDLVALTNEFGTKGREKLLFGDFESHPRKREVRDIKEAALRSEVLLNPLVGIKWLEQCRGRKDVSMLEVFQDVIEQRLEFLPIAHKILTAEELESLYSRLHLHSGLPNLTVSELTQFLETAGKLHRDQSEVMVPRARSTSGRSHAFDPFDDGDEELVPEMRPKRYRSEWEDIAHSEAYVGPFQNFNACIAVAHYILKYPERVDHTKHIAGMFLATIARHTLEEIPAEVLKCTELLLQDAQEIVSRDVRHEHPDGWLDMFPVESRDEYEKLNERWQEVNKLWEVFRVDLDHGDEPEKDSVEKVYRDWAAWAKRYPPTNIRGYIEMQIGRDVELDSQQNPSTKLNRDIWSFKKDKELTEESDQINNLWSKWKDLLETHSLPFDRSNAFLKEATTFDELFRESAARMEEEVRREIITPALERARDVGDNAEDWWLNMTYHLVKIIAYLAQFDGAEAGSLLRTYAQEEWFAGTLKTLFSTNEIDDNFGTADYAIEVRKAILDINFASIRYPQIAERHLFAQWEKDNSIRVSPRPTNEAWILFDELPAPEHEDAADQIVRCRKILTHVLHPDSTRRPRNNEDIRESLFTIRIQQRALETALRRRDFCDSDTHLLQRLSSLLRTLREGLEYQQTLDIRERSCLEELVPHVRDFGARYSNPTDPASEEERHRMAYMGVRFFDREAQEGRAFSPRKIPVADADHLSDIWSELVVHGRVEGPRATGPQNGEKSYDEPESPGGSDMEQIRDQLLHQLDNPEQSSSASGDSQPELPFAGLPAENPPILGEFSESLEGDTQYVIRKICTQFDTEWCAHQPASEDEALALRALAHCHRSDIDEGDTVTLRTRARNGDVIPLPCGARIDNVETENPHAVVGWSGHWTLLVQTSKPTDVEITYTIPNGNHEAGEQKLTEVLESLPEDLSSFTEEIANPENALEIPASLRRELDAIKPTLTTRPLCDVVEHVQQIIHFNYEYHFIVNDPDFKNLYRKLLEGMPYKNAEQNEYLAFIHSLVKDDDSILGRGVCGQLATVNLCSALRYLGIPAAYATGWCAQNTTVNANEAHAFLVAPMLDSDGRLFLKPLEATGGGARAIADAIDASDKVVLEEKPQSEEDCEEVKEVRSSETVETEKKVVQQRPHTEIEQWRSLIAASMQKDAIDTNDLTAVGHIIRGAVRLQAGNALDDVTKSVRRSVERQDDLGKGLTDLFDTQGYLFTPGVSDKARSISETLTDVLTERQIELLEYLILRNQLGHITWLDQKYKER